MVRRKNNIFQEFAVLSQGLYVESINLIIMDESTFNLISIFYINELTKELTVGKGLIKYVGKSNAEESIFIGYSEVTKSWSLRIKRSQTSELFSNFREQLLQSPTFSSNLDKVKLSSLSARSLCVPPSTMVNAKDFVDSLNVIISTQTKTSPKITIEGAVCYIGSKSGSNSLSISVVSNTVLAIGNITLFYKGKDANATKIFNNLIANRESSLEACIAYQMLEIFGSITLTPFLDYLRNNLLKTHAVGNIFNQNASSRAAFSKDGEYVRRSLSGVSNKLITTSSSDECKELVLDWLGELIQQQEFIKNGSDFIKKVVDTCNSKEIIKPILIKAPVIESEIKGRKRPIINTKAAKVRNVKSKTTELEAKLMDPILPPDSSSSAPPTGG